MGNRHSIAGRRLLAIILCATFLRALPVAHGDLYTNGVLSLEWLVDSSDEIHLVRMGPTGADKQPVVKSTRIVRARKDGTHLEEGQIRKAIYNWRLAVGLRPRGNEEWLLFVRNNEVVGRVMSWYVFRGVNLTQPLRSYFTAAVTREGEPLKNRQAILATVEARVRLNRRVPSNVDRLAVDGLAGNEGRGWSPDGKRGLESPYLKEHISGTLALIDCDYWDQAGPNDVDTWLNRAVIPVDPEDHARLLRETRGDLAPNAKRRFSFPILALVNFPGDETEQCLKDIVAGRCRSRSRQTVQYAQDVLRFFAYFLPPTDPRNKKLIGHWRLEGRHELIDFTFTRDQTFVASAFSRPKNEGRESRHMWDGQGYWMVRNGGLSIMRTHAREGLRWPERGREFFRYRKIERITPAAVVLEGGPPMNRR